ncbi:MAG: hypothetical protein Q8R15_00695 [Candidatus Micrarchaeota archaeon]|nr:hypothetical protein [Candidatus Micrarchaeota archaeon]
MPRRTHLEYDVKIGDRRIKILGIHHGSTMDNWPLSKRTRQIITKRAAAQAESKVYSEACNEAFLPQHLIQNAVPLESKEDRRLARWINKGLWWKMEQIAPGAKMSKKTSPIDEKNWRRILEDAKILDEDGQTAVKYLVIARSAAMATTLRNSPHSNIIAVMGSGHAHLVKKFLENEKLAQRYARLWQKMDIHPVIDENKGVLLAFLRRKPKAEK